MQRAGGQASLAAGKEKREIVSIMEEKRDSKSAFQRALSRLCHRLMCRTAQLKSISISLSVGGVTAVKVGEEFLQHHFHATQNSAMFARFARNERQKSADLIVCPGKHF